MLNFPLLTFAIWTPILIGILINMVDSARNQSLVRILSLIGSIISFFFTIVIVSEFNYDSMKLQFVEKVRWIESFNIAYYLGVDGLSIWFIVLTSFLTVIVIIAGWNTPIRNIEKYFSSFLILSGLIIGAFSAADALLFYIFFEATLIPMYLIIGIWGGSNRIYAAFKFFLYTLTGSLPMLIALIYLYAISGTFEIGVWHILPLRMTCQIILFIAFFFAFAVKVPMWPIHTWLPDAHVEAPVAGSIILAAVMLKLGAYGFLRFLLPILPDASHFFSPFIIALSLIAIIYVSFIALVQEDMKKLIAYSSISHMGFVTLGFFIFDQLGIEGSIIQMVSHGLISGAMFLSIGMLYDRTHTREIKYYGGVANTMPKLASFVLIFSMANCGLPGTSGFVGEFIIILSAIHSNFWIGFFSAMSLVLSAAYTLWMYRRVYFGSASSDLIINLQDVNKQELLMLITFAVLIIFIGLYPSPFNHMMHKSVMNLLLQTTQSKI